MVYTQICSVVSSMLASGTTMRLLPRIAWHLENAASSEPETITRIVSPMKAYKTPTKACLHFSAS